MMKEFGLYIDGAWKSALSGETYPSIDPATEQAWAIFQAAGREDLELAVQTARRTHESGVWRNTPPAERAAVLRRLADLLIENQDEIVLAEVQDSGGTFRKGNIADVPATMQNLQYYAELIESQEGDRVSEEFVPVESKNIITREPVGVVGAIVPFNFPMAAATFKIAPALAAGCTMVLKPSPYTPATALMMAELATEAGLPAGVLNIITGPSAQLGADLVSHPGIDKITFTGSTTVGKLVMKSAADTVKNILLELGGKSANIILEDANLEGAVPGSIFGTFFHSGQICQSGTRLLVHRSIHDTFVEQMVAQTKAKIRVGHPMEMETTMGPLISAKQLESVERYVEGALAQGATCVLGGKRPEGLPVGYYYEPTILTGVTNDMTVACEEVFGPVVAVIPFDTDEEALAIANESIYGLAAAVWSRDVERASAMARRLEAGTVWVNDYHLLAPQYEFGGYKMSGIGRELGPSGLAGYQQIKHIHVGQPTGPDEKFYFGLLMDG
jgi:aldehyde dehydrogenase (NAD+)